MDIVRKHLSRQMAYRIGEVGSQCRGKGPADHRTVPRRRSVGGDEVTDQAHNEGLDATTTESLAEPHSDLPPLVSPPRLERHNSTLQAYHSSTQPYELLDATAEHV